MKDRSKDTKNMTTSELKEEDKRWQSLADRKIKENFISNPHQTFNPNHIIRWGEIRTELKKRMVQEYRTYVLTNHSDDD